MAIPSQKAVRKIEFGSGSLPPSCILPKKRAVQVVISSSGRTTLSPTSAATYYVQTKPGLIRINQPVAVASSGILSPKEPPPDTILLSPQRNSTPETVTGGTEGVVENMNFPEEGMDECAAAMVLMNLSCSPRSPNCWATHPGYSNREVSSSWSDRLSPTSTTSSSGIASYPDATPSPPLAGHQQPGVAGGHDRNRNHFIQTHVHGGLHSVDEGILMDDGDTEYDSPKEGTRTAYKCTWKGCDFITLTCSVVEGHVREAHLGPKEEDSEDESDSEVEFYYSEVDINAHDFPDLFSATFQRDSSSRESSEAGWQHPDYLPHHHPHGQPPHVQYHQQMVVVGSVQEQHLTCNVGTVCESHGQGYFHASSAPTMSHMDMARPPHENPDLQYAPGSGSHQRSNPVPISIPQRGGSWHPYCGSPLSPHKYARFSPKSGSPKISILRQSRRADSKKCRKVYGVDNRDMWCTQCKWKKACTRFND